MELFAIRDTVTGFGFDKPLNRLPALSHCGDVECTRRARNQPHTHPCFEFHYYVSGSDAVRVGEAAYRLKRSDLLFTLPHERHGSDTGFALAHRFVWMGVYLDAFGQAGANLAAALRAYPGRVVPRCYDIEPIMQAIVRQVISQGPLCEGVVRQLLRAFILMLTQQVQMLSEKTPARSIAPYSIEVQKTLRFMRENVDKRLSLTEMCDASGAGKSVFCQSFTREVGESPAAHHLRLRLQAARLALKDPSQTIVGVAVGHGFGSSQHFSTSFKRHFGLTPRRWQLQS